MNTTEVLDVLIVGGGPSGLMAGLLLATYGINIRIIDAKAAVSENSRALVVQPRTLELFEQLGIVEDFLANGRKIRGATIYETNGRTDLNIYTTGKKITRYNFGLMHEQNKTENVLLKHLQQHGYDLEWQTELTSLEQTEHGVHIQLRRADGAKEKVFARHLIAADGASSIVRKLVGMPFSGNTTEQRFMVMDARVAGGFDEATMAFNVNANGDIALFPLSAPGRFRIISTLPSSFEGDDPTVEDFYQFVQENFPGGLELSEPEWFSPYHVHSRSVKHMRQGNIFFVGDAAHIHTPVGGQGMNTGLQDTANLAWKLALVLKGLVPESSLESYHTERHPVAQKLIQTSDRIFQTVSEDTPLARFVRVHLFAQLVKFVMQFPGSQERLFPTISMTGIGYGDGMLLNDTSSGFPKSAPKAGERWPYVTLNNGTNTLSSYGLLDYAHHHLFLFVGAAEVETATAFKQTLKQRFPITLHVVTNQAHPHALFGDAETFSRFRSRVSTAYLVRPDGYLALRTSNLSANALGATVQRYFGK